MGFLEVAVGKEVSIGQLEAGFLNQFAPLGRFLLHELAEVARVGTHNLETLLLDRGTDGRCARRRVRDGEPVATVATSTVAPATVAAAAFATAISTATVAPATVATPIATISSAVATLLTIATTPPAGYESVQLRDEQFPGVDDGQHLELMDTPIWEHAHPKHRTKRRCRGHLLLLHRGRRLHVRGYLRSQL